MIIKYVNYTDGVHELEFTKSAGELGLESPIFGDVILKCRMDKSFYQIILDCNVYFSANFECDRCCNDYSSYLTNYFQVTYLFGTDETPGEDSGVKYLTHDDDKIDITDEVIEYALLAVPMKKVCSEDCKGLCSICGTNLNENNCDCKIEITNSVWDKLKKLKDNN